MMEGRNFCYACGYEVDDMRRHIDLVHGGGMLRAAQAGAMSQDTGDEVTAEDVVRDLYPQEEGEKS